MSEEWDLLRRITPEDEYAAALTLYRGGAVHPLEEENGVLRYAVDGEVRRLVRVGASGSLAGRCACDFFINVHRPCRHLAAALMHAISCGAVEELRRRRARENAPLLMGALQSALPTETPLSLEVTLRAAGAREPLRVSLRVGQERLYVVKSVAQFLQALQEKRRVSFGKGFTLEPEWMGFSGVDEKIIRLLQDAAYVAQLEGRLAQTGLDAKFLILPERFTRRLLQLLMAKPFRLTAGERTHRVPCVFAGQAELLFGVSLSGRELEIRAQMPKSLRPLDPEGEFVFCEGDVLRLPDAQRDIVRALCACSQGAQAFFRYDAAHTERVISELLPALERAGSVAIDGALAERLVRRPLSVRAYFDRDARLVVCRMVFRYGEEEINPFAPQAEREGRDDRLLMLRDADGERRALDLLAAYGFRMQRGRIVLSGQEEIYRFLTEGIYALRDAAEVYCSDEFKRMTPRRPNFSGVLRLQEGLLRLTLSENGEPEPEVYAILQALRERRRYVRLKDGAFLDLTDMDEWRDLAEAAAGAQDADDADDDGDAGSSRGVLQLASYRAAYMLSLLEGGRLPVAADDSVRQLVRSMDADGEPCPQPLAGQLRP